MCTGREIQQKKDVGSATEAVSFPRGMFYTGEREHRVGRGRGHHAAYQALRVDENNEGGLCNIAAVQRNSMKRDEENVRMTKAATWTEFKSPNIACSRDGYSSVAA